MNNVLPRLIETLPGEKKIRAHIPIHRRGHVKESADTVAFLVSDAAGYITGQSLRWMKGLREG